MSDTDTNILEKIRLSGKFAIQVDDSTDISGDAQLLVNVCFLDKDVIKEYLFFCKRLPKNTTGEEIFFVAFVHIIEQRELEWKSWISVWTDGAAAMVGYYKNFIGRIGKK